jgi:hypothetical protein
MELARCFDGAPRRTGPELIMVQGRYALWLAKTSYLIS